MKKKVILLVGGGTKGHLFAAISLAQSLQNDENKTPVIISDINDVIETKGLKTISIPRMPAKGGVINTVVLLWNMQITLIKLIFKYFELKPKVIVGFGGFTTFIPLVAAIILRIPIILHEQNSVMGKVNEIMARYACKISLGFFDALTPTQNYAHKCVFSKNPIRSKIEKVHKHQTSDVEVFSILVIGGSQGARAFNDIVPNAIKLLKQLHPSQKLKIVQQAHRDQQKNLKNFYTEIEVNYELEEFFLNMPNKYHDASLVICRSGASTIEELVSITKPSILIPLPHAAKNHQAINASYLEKLGCAWLINQDKNCVVNLANQLSLILQSPNMLANAAKHLLRLKNQPRSTLAQEINKFLATKKDARSTQA